MPPVRSRSTLLLLALAASGKAYAAAPIAYDVARSLNEDTMPSVTLRGSDPERQSLTFYVDTGPEHGAVVMTGRTLTYTPTRDFTGTDTLSYYAVDAEGLASNVANVTFTVNPVNDAPTAPSATLSTDEDTPGTVALPATDVDGDALTFGLAAEPGQGTASVDPTTGEATYTPPANWAGTTSFRYSASDGARSAEALVVVTVLSVNDAPVANAAEVTGGEDTPSSTSLTAVDAENDALTFTLATQPAHGTATLVNRRVTYVPDPDFNGTDSVEFTVSDGAGTSEPATVTFTVTAANDAPTAVADTVTLDEDTSSTFALYGGDVDGDTLTFGIVSAPLVGDLEVDPVTGQATYTPPANWSGSTTFRYEVSDGELTASAIVTVVVNAVADTPVAVDAVVTTAEDTAASFTLGGTDPEGDALTFTVETPPTHGSVGLVGASAVYTPEADWSGDDSFTFVVSDGTTTSAPATVTITVEAVNDAPVVAAASFDMDQDSTATFTMTATDVEGDALTWSLAAAPANGSVSVDATTGEVTVSPDAGYAGALTFVVEVSDGVTVAQSTVTVTVIDTAEAPVVADVAASGTEDTAVTLVLAASDPDGDPLTCTLDAPAHGTASLVGLLVTYVPPANFNGDDTFTYACSDGTHTSPSATVVVSLAPTNDRPTATNTTFTAEEDGSVTFDLPASDIDGDALTYALLTAPSVGSLSYDPSTGSATFTPPANWAGSTGFRFTATDGSSTASAQVTLEVTSVNDAPTANAATATLSEDGAVTVGLTGSDPDSTSLSYSIATMPAHGTLTLSGRNATYVPEANFTGPDSFTFVVTDGIDSSAPAVVDLTVNAVNDPPVAYAVSGETDEDVPLVLALSGSDLDGDVVSFALETTPANGEVTIDAASGLATFTPAPNASGTMTFSYRAYDGTAWSAPASAIVTVVSVDDTPTAVSQTVAIDEDAAVTAITLEGSDPDAASSLSYALVSMPTHGSVGLTGRSAMYQPDPDFHGTDSFTFVVSDGTYTSAPATVTVEVASVNDAPVARSTSAMTDGATISLALYGDDIDGDSLTMSVGDAPMHGTASVVDGELVYTPDAGYFGMDRLTVVVDDGTNTSSAAVRVSVISPWDGGTLANWSQIGVNSLPFYADADAGDPLSATDTHLGSYILDDLYDIGAESYRQLRAADVTWQSYEPVQGQHAYGDSDDLFAQDEVEPRLTLFSTTFGSPTPPWATTEAEFESQMNPAAYAYLDSVLERYAGEARYWELCNEMFHWSAVTPDADPTTIPGLPEVYPSAGYTPEEQATFLRDAAEYIRAADPAAIIVLPSVLADSDSTGDWLARVVAATGSDWFDVVTYHAYDEWDVVRSQRARFDDDLLSLGLEDKLVQLTEVGTTSYADNVETSDYPNSPATQAMDIFRQFLPAFAAGDSAVIWHTYREFAEAHDGTYAGMGLYDYDSVPRDAAYTYALFASELLPVVQVTDLSDEAAGTFRYEVRSADGSDHTVMWGSGTVSAPDGATEMVYVVPDELHDHTWLAVPADGRVTLSDEPVMFR